LFIEKFPGFKLEKKRVLKKWIRSCIEGKGKKCGDITFVFDSDAEIREINKKYLQHDWFTDVIAFDYNEGNTVNGDILISVERVRENAGIYKVEENEEIRRVMIHGVLHLLGHEDDTEKKKNAMHEEENACLRRWTKEVRDGKI